METSSGALERGGWLTAGRFIRAEGGGYIYDDGRRRNGNDGLIFTPATEGYNTKRILKWKWPELNTIDFKLFQPFVGRDGASKLYVAGEQRSDVLVKNVRFTEQETQWLGKFPGDAVVVECAFDRGSGAWKIERARRDKQNANFITVAWETMEIIAENVSLEEVKASARARKRNADQIES